jgi:hypothetical protein
MKLAFLAVLVFLALPLAAQTAKVIQLSPADATARKALEEQRAAIEQKIKELDAQIQHRYTTVLQGDKDASGSYADIGLLNTTGITYACFATISNDPAVLKAYQDCERSLEAERAKNPPPPQRMYRIGWASGFEYTEDFKFIVPVLPKTSGDVLHGCNWTYPVNSMGTINLSN